MVQIAIGEAFEKVINTLSEHVDEVQKEVVDIFEDCRQIIDTNPWELLYNVFYSLESKYNQNILTPIKKEIEIWGNGDGSYINLTSRFKMGDAAKQEAERQQSLIIENIHRLSELTVISDITPDFSNTSFILEDVKNKLEDVSAKSKHLIEIVDSHINELNTLANENESVSTIVSVGITYGENIATFITEVINRISDILSENIDTMKQSNDQVIEISRESAKNFNQTIEDTLTSMNDFLTDLFE